ncbi:hypothetical protein Moror_16384 [Moniliophthora roreri MCA 2997]|uniref:Uncharacterized protein n=2 Tax=Moniliophthora roreri TaxID=221103 RepID=V2XDQ9_MONRO|nr:hypothetical protein Moror_16384 [Moniliophthora roreri MCA 2997]KAI3601399.1 hypothetical protein WG66_002593 [Moniliophthora roreri]
MHSSVASFCLRYIRYVGAVAGGGRRQKEDICKELKGEPSKPDDAKPDVVVVRTQPERSPMVYHHFDPATLLDTTKILASSIRRDGHLAIVDNKLAAADDDTELDGDMPKQTIGKPNDFAGAEMERFVTACWLLIVHL